MTLAEMEQRVHAYVGLGANVGEPRSTLERAISALAALPGVELTGVSRLYRTRPVGPVAQDDFLNAVVGLLVPTGNRPEEGAMALLLALKGLERALGRLPRERWGPREVDLDLLLFGEAAIRVERTPATRSEDPARDGVQWLEVPHPSAVSRLFVLAPLADLAPELEPPGWGLSVSRARDDAEQIEGPGAVNAVACWDLDRSRWRDLAQPA